MYNLNNFGNRCINYAVIMGITPQKLYINYYVNIKNDNFITHRISSNGRYINKHYVLNKLEYDDNELLYIKLKKYYFYHLLQEEIIMYQYYD